MNCEQRIKFSLREQTVYERRVYLFDCCLARHLNLMKRSKSRIKLNVNTSVDVLRTLQDRWLSFRILNTPNTGYLDNIVFRMSWKGTFCCSLHSNTEKNKRKHWKQDVLDYLVRSMWLLFTVQWQVKLWLWGFWERLHSALIKSPKLLFTPSFRTAFALSKYLNFKWFGVLPGREIVSRKRLPK